MIETGYNKVILLGRGSQTIDITDKDASAAIVESMLKKWKVPNKHLWLKELEIEKLLKENFKDIK